MELLDRIRFRQVLRFGPVMRTDIPPEPQMAKPEMLYIGCIEPKLDPIRDIGIPIGGATIARQASGFVHGLAEDGTAPNPSEACALQLAVNEQKVKHIVVSAHSQCAALGACMHGCRSGDSQFVDAYLAPLHAIRDEAKARFPDDAAAQMRQLEEETVRMSIEKLKTYPFVRAAMERGELQLHGWLIDIGSKQIAEMDPETRQFEPMAQKYKHLATHDNMIRAAQFAKDSHRLASIMHG